MGQERTDLKLGDFRCKIITDRTYQGPMDFAQRYPTAPPDQLQAVLAEYKIDPSNIIFSYNCLFVDTGKSKILVDTGIGADQQGQLLSHLKTEGIDPASISHVIITHGHGDHIGGLTDANGQVNFPNAQFWIWKDEWDYFADPAVMASHPEQAAAMLKKNFSAIAPEVNLLSEERQFLPGVTAIHVPGHTVGMMALLFESKGQKLIAVADSFHRPFQIEHTSWNIAFDRVPEKAPTSRIKILKRAVAEDALFLAYHFPHPGLGKIKLFGKTWKWEAV